MGRQEVTIPEAAVNENSNVPKCYTNDLKEE
jgi:hypothetical protein